MSKVNHTLMILFSLEIRKRIAHFLFDFVTTMYKLLILLLLSWRHVCTDVLKTERSTQAWLKIESLVTDRMNGLRWRRDDLPHTSNRSTNMLSYIDLDSWIPASTMWWVKAWKVVEFSYRRRDLCLQFPHLSELNTNY